MRTIRPLASWILLPATIGLLAAYVWHACTARWDIPPAAVIGLALVAGAAAELVDRIARHTAHAWRRRRLPTPRPRHRKEQALLAAYTTTETTTKEH
ncbi:hypothetical protein [Streptomyces sp. FxanaA7]|uniref:hypothetical protein n=1 Tax=Streptomyces sp. FxanaA7 TaxID=1265492 RepID=UPI0005EFD47A|nr:hypothetical protein [Streptomyces sp. FxanaA7]